MMDRVVQAVKRKNWNYVKLQWRKPRQRMPMQMILMEMVIVHDAHDSYFINHQL